MLSNRRINNGSSEKRKFKEIDEEEKETEHNNFSLCKYEVVSRRRGQDGHTDLSNLLSSQNFKNKNGLLYIENFEKLSEIRNLIIALSMKSKLFTGQVVDMDDECAEHEEPLIIICSLHQIPKLINVSISFIIHYTLPSSLSIYLTQTTSIAQLSTPLSCILFYSCHELRALMWIEPIRPELLQVGEYVERRDKCRRVFLKEQSMDFDNSISWKCELNIETTCDICSNGWEAYRNVDVSQEAKFVVQSIKILTQKTGYRLTFNDYIDSFKGSLKEKLSSRELHKLPFSELGKNWARRDIETFLMLLLLRGILRETGPASFNNESFPRYIKLFCGPNESFSEPFYLPLPHSSIPKFSSLSLFPGVDLDESSREIRGKQLLYSFLISKFRVLSLDLNITAFTLRAIAAELPMSSSDLKRVPGLPLSLNLDHERYILSLTQKLFKALIRNKTN